MPIGGLPGFVWDSRMRGGRYRRLLPDGRLGRLVSRDSIVVGLRQIADNASTALSDLAMALYDGKLTLADTQLAGQSLLKDLYNAYSALARGGWSRMNAAAFERNTLILQREYGFWRNFLREVVGGGLTEKRIRARAALYAGKAYSRFWAEDRLLKLEDSGYTHEQWLAIGDERMCGDCGSLMLLGKVPLGTLPTVPGASDLQCRGACRCIISYF